MWRKKVIARWRAGPETKSSETSKVTKSDSRNHVRKLVRETFAGFDPKSIKSIMAPPWPPRHRASQYNYRLVNYILLKNILTK